MVRISLALLLSSGLSFAGSKQSFMPENDLNLEDNMVSPDANLTEVVFNEMMAKTQAFYAPFIAAQHATLKIVGDWNDATVNAYAQKEGTVWNVHMFGGLARRAEITQDGFQIVMCHELGHHFAGYHFVVSFFGNQNMASEGQSDYYATQACSRAMWKDQVEANAAAAAQAPEIVKTKCAQSWNSENDRNLCARQAMAGKALADLLSKLPAENGGDPQPIPEFNTPDTSVVAVSDMKHPKAQCRLDTYFAGALCNKAFEMTKIPGLASGGTAANNATAEKAANLVSCATANHETVGVRPTCWFKPLVN